MRCYKLKRSSNTTFQEDSNIITHKELIAMKCTIPNGGRNRIAIRDMEIKLGKDIEEYEWRIDDVRCGTDNKE